MKKIIFSLLCFLFLTSLVFAIPQTNCPINKDEAVDKKVFTDYKGYRIYFCCKSCIENFIKDGENFIKKMKAANIELEKSPVAETKKEVPADEKAKK